MADNSSGEARIAALFELLGGPAILLAIPTGQKRPVDDGWQQFGDEEMSNPDYIARFNNGTNIGVVLGLPSGGLCSIDVDENELVEEFLKHNPALRKTLCTRRLKGCNFWIRVTGPYPALKPFHHSRLLNDKKKPRQIGEWRSTGGQTVIEGEAEGRAYEIVYNAHPITISFADIVWPEWISDPPCLDEPTVPQTTGSLDENKLENVVKHGNGSVHAACPACREDGEDGSGNHLFIKVDGKFGCCKYPADKEHRKRVWNLVGIKTLLTRSGNSSSEYFQTNVDERGNPIDAIELPPIVEACNFVTAEIPPLPILVDGLLHQGTKLVLGGGSKAYKTWLLGDLAIAIIAELLWLGFQCKKGRVLYINLEIQDRFFQERLKVLASKKGVQFTAKSLDLWNLRGFASPYHTLVPLMIERIKSEEYSLVIVDPIYKLYGKTDENSAGEVAQLLNTLETVCTKTKAAVAFGAHYSKGNQAAKESIDRISGSGVFARDPDSIIPFTKHEEDGCFVVEPILRNLPPIESFVVRWNYPLMERDDALDPERLKQIIKPGKQPMFDPLDLLSFISANTKENPVSINSWAKLASVKRQTLTDYLDKMRSNHWIATIGEGTSARQYITEKGLSALQ